MIFTKQQIVSSNYLGADAKLSALGVFQLVENAITEGMAAQHIDGMTIRRLYGAFWVFSKNKVEILDEVEWGDTVTVESFVSSKSSAKLNVDTAIKKAEGQIVAYSRCEMCPLDVATGRIRRTSTVGVDDSIVVEPALREVAFDKLNCDDLPVVEEVTVRSTNIDFSRHANNVEYLRFIFNTYSVQELLSRPIRELEVNYVSQSYEGDVLRVHKAAVDGCDLFAITKSAQLVIKCTITR